MIWRPVLVFLAVIAAVAANVVLLAQERIPEPADKPIEALEEPLRHVEYRDNNRRRNLTDSFGMDPALAERTAKRIEQVGRSKAQLQKLLKENAGAVTEAFCPSDELPQPYAALEFLVYEQNGRRDVFQPDRLAVFEPQAWFQVNRGYVSSVYSRVELSGRKADATLMGVSGLLLMRERDVLEGNSPWSQSVFGTWGFSRLVKEQASIEQLATEYFAFMHLLTELANAPDGICT
ncbi:MAG: hypothetical protein H0V89_14165 [Deltaproteobacteria bacterium]|nr:hypothetical protein [Deltaproteobacteria bacterium]